MVTIVKSMPKHSQLKAILGQEIAAMQPGDRIESVRDLMRRYQLSYATVDRALRDLAGEGVIRKVHGKGTFVAPANSGNSAGNKASTKRALRIALLGVDSGQAAKVLRDQRLRACAPGITIDWKCMPATRDPAGFYKLDQYFAEAGQSDMFMVWQSFATHLAARNMLAEIPMSWFEDNLPQTSLSSATLDLFRAGKKLFAVPLAVDPAVVFCNLDLFAQQGVTLPGKAPTWPEFRRMAKNLTTVDQKTGAKIFGFHFNLGLKDILPYLWSNRGLGLPLTHDLNPRAITETLHFLYNLRHRDRTCLLLDSVEGVSPRELFLDNSLAMMQGRYHQVHAILRAWQDRPERLGVMSLPCAKTAATMVSINCIGINPSSPHFDACLRIAGQLARTSPRHEEFWSGLSPWWKSLPPLQQIFADLLATARPAWNRAEQKPYQYLAAKLVRPLMGLESVEATVIELTEYLQ